LPSLLRKGELRGTQPIGILAEMVRLRVRWNAEERIRGISERPDTGMRRVTPGRRTTSRERGINGMVDFAVKPIL
jgi:hypothetical protein